MRKPLSRTRTVRGLLAWLALLLVLGQTQGLLHGVAHVPHGAGASALAPWVAEDAGGERASEGWLARLFAGHDDPSGCRLFDQASHGDCLPGVPTLASPSGLVGCFVAVFAALAPLPAPALVHARGPPPVR